MVRAHVQVSMEGSSLGWATLPADVPLLALPVGDCAPISMAAHSPRCADVSKDMEHHMLTEEAEWLSLQEELRSGIKKPYRDLGLEEQVYELAIRFAKGRMLRAVKKVEAEVGYSSVIKEATRQEDGTVKIVLRLIFDKSIPNELWRRSPWVASARPVCVAAVGLSAAQEEQAGAKL